MPHPHAPPPPRTTDRHSSPTTADSPPTPPKTPPPPAAPAATGTVTPKQTPLLPKPPTPLPRTPARRPSFPPPNRSCACTRTSSTSSGRMRRFRSARAWAAAPRAALFPTCHPAPTAETTHPRESPPVPVADRETAPPTLLEQETETPVPPAATGTRQPVAGPPPTAAEETASAAAETAVLPQAVVSLNPDRVKAWTAAQVATADLGAPQGRGSRIPASRVKTGISVTGRTVTTARNLSVANATRTTVAVPRRQGATPPPREKAGLEALTPEVDRCPIPPGGCFRSLRAASGKNYGRRELTGIYGKMLSPGWKNLPTARE